jgi:hypothetical protein
MDLAFHSRVVRKLFHNYKHQLHNIMKYQLSLQKELNLKYQQEKQFKQQIVKLEDDLKIAQTRPLDVPKFDGGLSFADPEQIREKHLGEVKRIQDQVQKDLKAVDNPNDNKVMQDIRDFLNKDFKVEDSTKLREELSMILRQLERERENSRHGDPTSDEYKNHMLNNKAAGDAMRRPMYDIGMMVILANQTDPVIILNPKDTGSKENSELAKLSNELGTSRLRIDSLEEEFKKLREEADKLKKDLDEKTQALTFQEGLYNEMVKKNEATEKELDTVRKDAEQLAIESKKLEHSLNQKEEELARALTSLAAAEAEARNWMEIHDEIKESTGKEIEALKKKLAESEAKHQKLQGEYDSLKIKFDSIIKGGENLDNVTKNYYTNLESELAEAKKGIEKFK